MKLSRQHILTATLILGGFISSHTHAHELVLNIDKITVIKGKLMIALYDSADHYKTNTHMVTGKQVAVTQDSMQVNLGDLPPGNYAVKLFQDENENGKLDTNVIGIPSEAYGFSNNGGSMGQPDFEEAKFLLNGNTHIQIHLR